MGLKTVVIHPGEKIILPSNTVIDSLILDGSITVTSTCDDLPDPTSYKCGYFWFVLDQDDNSKHSMDGTSTYYMSLKVANNTYDINRLIIVGSNDNPGTLTSVAVLNTHVPDQVIFSFTNVDRELNTGPGLDHNQRVYLFFKVAENLFNDVELKVSNKNSLQYYRPLEAECDVYDIV